MDKGLGKIRVHTKTPEFVARAAAHIEFVQPFNGIPFSQENLETQEQLFAQLVEYPSPLLLGDDHWEDAEGDDVLLKMRHNLEVLQTGDYKVGKSLQRINKIIGDLQSTIMCEAEGGREGKQFDRESTVGARLFPLVLSDDAMKITSLTEQDRFWREGNVEYYNLKYDREDRYYESSHFNFNFLLPDTAFSNNDADAAVTADDLDAEMETNPNVTTQSASLQDLFGEEVFGKTVGEIWESTILNACVSQRLYRNHKTEVLVLDSARRVDFGHVLKNAEIVSHPRHSEEALGMLEFVLRIDGFRPESPPAIQDSLPETPPLADVTSSNLFFFEVPLSRNKLLLSLMCGKNTLLPSMLDSENFAKIVNLEFMESANRGLTLSEMDQLKNGRFFSKSRSPGQSATEARKKWFFDRCNVELFGLGDVLTCRNGSQQSGDRKNQERFASLNKSSSDTLKTLRSNNWVTSKSDGTSDPTADYFKFEDWFQVMGSYDGRSSILAVRKDIWLAWVSTWMVHRRNSALPTYEILLKHWKVSSSGFKMIDKVRKYNVLRKMLTWLTQNQENQIIHHALSPDHVDFDEIYDNLFGFLDMWNNSTVAVENAINESYLNPGAPSILKSLVAAILVKKHHVVDHDVLHELRGFIHGLNLKETLSPECKNDVEASTALLAARRSNIEKKHPFLLSVVETLCNRDTTSDLEHRYAGLAKLTPRTARLMEASKIQASHGKKRTRDFAEGSAPHAEEVILKETKVGGRYISTSAYGWDLYTNHRGCKKMFEQKRRKIGHLNEGGLDVSTLYKRIVRKGENGIRVIYSLSNKKQYGGNLENVRSASTPWVYYDYHSDPTTMYINPTNRPLSRDNHANDLQACYLEDMSTECGVKFNDWQKQRLLDKILSNCSYVTPEERKYMHLWLDDGCVSELKYDYGVKPWNQKIDGECSKIYNLFATSVRKKRYRRAREVTVCNGPLQNFSQAKRFNIWKRTHQSRGPVLEDLDFVERGISDCATPKWMILGEYMATKVLYKVCACDLFPLSLRKKLFLALCVVDNTEMKNKKREHRDSEQVLYNAENNKTIFLGMLDPKGKFTCDRYEPVNFKPSSLITQTAYASKYGTKMKRVLENHRKKFKNYLGEMEQTPIKVDSTANASRNRPDSAFQIGQRVLRAQNMSSSPDQTTFECKQVHTRESVKEEWLWQDTVLFGGNDRKRALVDYLSREELVSTVPETMRLILGMVEYAYQNGYALKAQTKGFTFERSQDALLPYKPCYQGFKKNLFEQACHPEQQVQTVLRRSEIQQTPRSHPHPHSRPQSNSQHRQPKNLSYMTHFKLNVPKSGPSRGIATTNSMFFHCSETQGWIPNITYVDEGSMTTPSRKSATSTWAPRRDTKSPNLERKLKKNPSYDDAVFVLFHTDFTWERIKALNALTQTKKTNSKKSSPRSQADPRKSSIPDRYPKAMCSSTLYQLEACCMLNFLPATFVCSSRLGTRVTKIGIDSPNSSSPTSPSTGSSSAKIAPNFASPQTTQQQQQPALIHNYDAEKLQKFLKSLEEDGTAYKLYEPEVDSPEQKTVWLEDQELLLVTRYDFPYS